MGIAVLGPLVVNDPPERLGPRDRVILAALTVSPGAVLTGEQLADALWGEHPPATWGKVVQGCVMRLRKVLGPPAIETTQQGYRLALPVDAVDAQRFERLLARSRELLNLAEPERAAYTLGEALALWRGRPFADLEDWDAARVATRRLDELRRDAEELRLDAALQNGRSREILGEAQQRVGEEPLRERRWALLALAQYQADRQADALRTLREVREVLAAELGLDPGPELVALEAAILRQDPSLMAQSALPEPGGSCPYPGLLPYDLVDTDVFFGRDAEVSSCLRRFHETGLVVVTGASGCGKSSLVRAGIAASLRRDGRRVRVVTPGRRPMDALSAPGVPGEVLVVDQAEEVFTLCADVGERTRFLDALAGYAGKAGLIVAIRADRLGDVSAHPVFARVVERGLFLLGAMDRADLRVAIEGPAHRDGLLLEPGLVDLLVQEVEGEPGALPLLAHALRETWAHREGRTLTVDGYRSTGGIRGAVARSAEEIYTQLAAEERTIVRDLLLRLVVPAADGGPARTRVPRRLAAADAAHEGVVEQLVAARLVTSGDGVLELAHEALVRAWPRLQDWLHEDEDGQRIRRHLAVSADTWDTMGRPDSELYRGVRPRADAGLAGGGTARPHRHRERLPRRLSRLGGRRAATRARARRDRGGGRAAYQAARRRTGRRARARAGGRCDGHLLPTRCSGPGDRGRRQPARRHVDRGQLLGPVHAAGRRGGDDGRHIGYQCGPAVGVARAPTRHARGTADRQGC